MAKFISLLSLGLGSSVVSGVHVQDVGGPFGLTIHSVPKLMPTDVYKQHMRDQGGSAAEAEYAKLQAKYAKLLAAKGGEEEASEAKGDKVEKKESEGAPEGDHAGTLFAVGMYGAVVLIAAVF